MASIISLFTVLISSRKDVNANASKESSELDSKKEGEVVTWFNCFFWTPRPYFWSAAFFKMTSLLIFIAFLAFCWAVSRMRVIFPTLRTCFALIEKKRCFVTNLWLLFPSFGVSSWKSVSCGGHCCLVKLTATTFSVIFAISLPWISASSNLLMCKRSCCNVTSRFRKQYRRNLLFSVAKIIYCLISVSNVAPKSHFTACSFKPM